ncbi:cation transporter [bacterium]|nr:cation transporter [bacterium]
MSHDHQHGNTGNIKVAFLLNLGFTLLEIVGGIWTNSMAILSDAIHDLGDSLSLGLSWYLQHKSGKARNQKFTFGYYRFSLLGAVINGMVLIAGSAYILIETVPRLVNPEETNAEGMLLFAILGILVNGAAVWRLSTGKSMNERMVRWHLLEDVLGWVAVLIVSIVLMFWDVPILDPLLSLLILAYVLYNVFRNLRSTVNLFLQAAPEDVDLEHIKNKVNKLPGVLSSHHSHVWSLDGEHHVLTMHVVLKELDRISDIIRVKRSVKEVLKSSNIDHATIEIEFEDEDCYMNEGSHTAQEPPKY